MHILSDTLQYIQILVQHFLECLFKVLHLIGSRYISRSIHSSRTVNVYDRVLAPMHLLMQFLNQPIDIVEVYSLADVGQYFGCPVRHFGWIKQRAQDNSASILGYFLIFFEKFFLDVLIFGFFGSEGIEKANHDEPISVEASKLGKVAFEFFDLKLFPLIDRQIASDQKRFELRVGVHYTQSFWQKLRVGGRQQKDQAEQLSEHRMIFIEL